MRVLNRIDARPKPFLPEVNSKSAGQKIGGEQRRAEPFQPESTSAPLVLQPQCSTANRSNRARIEAAQFISALPQHGSNACLDKTNVSLCQFGLPLSDQRRIGPLVGA